MPLVVFTCDSVVYPKLEGRVEVMAKLEDEDCVSPAPLNSDRLFDLFCMDDVVTAGSTDEAEFVVSWESSATVAA